MVKLVPAKCPSCGAKLELDDNMKKVECEYCHNIIIVDEALAKNKQASGNIRVSDVKDYSDKLLIAQKHIKAGKYTKAKEVLEKILVDDEYNMDALEEYVSLLLDYKDEFLKNVNYDYRYIDEIDDKIHMIESTDDDGDYKKFVKEAKEKRNKLKEKFDKRREEEEEENKRRRQEEEKENERRREESERKRLELQKEASIKFHNQQIKDLTSECEKYIDLDKSKNKRINELKKHFNVDSITYDSLVDTVKNNEQDEIKYVQNLVSSYHKNKQLMQKREDIISKVLSVIICGIILFEEWSYMIADIANSMDDFTLLTPIAVIIYIALGIGVSLLIIAVVPFICKFISKVVIKLFSK